MVFASSPVDASSSSGKNVPSVFRYPSATAAAAAAAPPIDSAPLRRQNPLYRTHTRCSPPVRSHRRRSYPIISHILDTTPTAIICVCVCTKTTYIYGVFTHTHTVPIANLFPASIRFFFLAKKSSPRRIHAVWWLIAIVYIDCLISFVN